MTDTPPTDPDRDRSVRQERVAGIVVAVLLGLAAILVAVIVGWMFGVVAALVALVAFAIVIAVAGFDWIA